MQTPITSSAFTGGSYKRTQNRVVLSTVFELSPQEARLVRKGRRGCSINSRLLSRLGERCFNTAHSVGAKSWSIFPLPLPHDCGEIPKVLVEFHNWPEMGHGYFGDGHGSRTGFNRGKKRFWWDVREIEEWINPNDPRAVEDKHSNKYMFDYEA